MFETQRESATMKVLVALLLFVAVTASYKIPNERVKRFFLGVSNQFCCSKINNKVCNLASLIKIFIFRIKGTMGGIFLLIRILFGSFSPMIKIELNTLAIFLYIIVQI